MNEITSLTDIMKGYIVGQELVVLLDYILDESGLVVMPGYPQGVWKVVADPRWGDDNPYKQFPHLIDAYRYALSLIIIPKVSS